MEKYRIAMLSLHSNPVGELGTKDTGGMSVYVRELARELGVHGHMIDIFTRKENIHTQQIIELCENVRLIHLSVGNDKPVPKLALYSHIQDYFDVMDAFRLREDLHYNLMHSHYWLSGLLGILAQNHWEIPHVITFHTLGRVKNLLGIGDPEPDIRLSSEEKVAKTSHRILAPTEQEKENIIQHYSVPGEKIGLVPGGINLDFFRLVNKSDARNALGLDVESIILLFAGRFDPLKGLERLLKAMTCFQQQPKPHLMIIGGDGDGASETRRLKDLTRAFKIDDVVTFAGRIDQEKLVQYYNAADVLVLPSYYESFGLVGLEALACGTPVVATRVGAMERILRHNKSGHVVSGSSPNSLASAIESMVSISHTLSSDDMRASISEYSWSHVASTLLDEYSNLIH